MYNIERFFKSKRKLINTIMDFERAWQRKNDV